jgi:CRISPR/Cas system-associated exonuclease Cas4 (RecB family)
VSVAVLEHLVNYYLREQYKKQTRPMRKLHPSTIGMCQRRIVFDMLMVPKMMPKEQLMRVFENGHSMHHRYEKMFADMGILVQNEMKLEFEDISGHTDAWIRVYSIENPIGVDYLVELKSAYSKSFEWMVKNNAPKKEHRDQLMFYLHLVQKMGLPIRRGIIFVENKDTQEVWEYELEYDPVLGQQLEEKANWCIALAKERKLPPIPPQHTPSYYKCATCDYNFYCHAGATTQAGYERYPIPFRFGSKAYADAFSIIDAIQNNQPIPNVIVGDTNGALATEVEMYNNMLPVATPKELVSNYIRNTEQKDGKRHVQ